MIFTILLSPLAHQPPRNIESIYANGRGALQGYTTAHMYWNIASVNGVK